MFLDSEKYYIKRPTRETIEPEEIFLDAKKNEEAGLEVLPRESKLEIPIQSKLFFIFYGVIIIFLLGFLIRVAQLQFFNSDYFQSLAEKNKTRFFIFSAPRGIIYDRALKPLVRNVPSFDLMINPLELPWRPQEREELANRLSRVLDRPVEEIDEEIKRILALKKKSVQRFLLASNLNHDQILRLEAEAKDLPAVKLEENSSREYLLKEAAAHLLGFLGKLTDEEQKDHPDYFWVEKIGKNGLEKQYEYYLRGQPGYKKIEVDARGETAKILGVKEARAGLNLVLSLDGDLQNFFYEQMAKAVKPFGGRGAGVAFDSRNGQLLAMVSLPSFDNNFFSQIASEKELDKIFTQANQPLFNRAISGSYPSGSVIKPFIASAALEEGIVSVNTKIDASAGQLIVPNPYGPSQIFHDWKKHGWVNILQALAQSSNVFFYYMGGGYGDFKGLGIERINKYLNLFGFGQFNGIDLPQEAKGLIPNPKWKLENKNEKWYIGDTYNTSIGQGDVGVTPLQLAVATAAIANGGVLYETRVVDRIVDSDKNTITKIQPRALRSGWIGAENLQIVRKGMRQAVIEGSARFLNSLPVEVAGKTGTAEIGNGRTQAWFIGFAPYINPKIVLVILIEEGGEGSSSAVPVAKEIWQWYFNNKNTN